MQHFPLVFEVFPTSSFVINMFVMLGTRPRNTTARQIDYDAVIIAYREVI